MGLEVGLEVGIKEVDPTCLSPVSMQDERVLSEVRRLFFVFIKKQVKTDVFTNGGRNFPLILQKHSFCMQRHYFCMQK